jgi:hypothetical protein
VDAELVFTGLFRRGAFSAEEMADPAIHLGRIFMRESGDVDMTLGALKETVDRLFEQGAIDVSFRAFLTVTIVTRVFGKSRRRNHEADEDQCRDEVFQFTVSHPDIIQ